MRKKEEIAYLLLRVTLGANIFLHGFSRLIPMLGIPTSESSDPRYRLASKRSLPEKPASSGFGFFSLEHHREETDPDAFLTSG